MGLVWVFSTLLTGFRVCRLWRFPRLCVGRFSLLGTVSSRFVFPLTLVTLLRFLVLFPKIRISQCICRVRSWRGPVLDLEANHFVVWLSLCLPCCYWDSPDRSNLVVTFKQGRAPALLDNLAQAFLMAPYFVLLEVCFLYSFPYCHTGVFVAKFPVLYHYWRNRIGLVCTIEDLRRKSIL